MAFNNLFKVLRNGNLEPNQGYVNNESFVVIDSYNEQQSLIRVPDITPQLVTAATNQGNVIIQNSLQPVIQDKNVEVNEVNAFIPLITNPNVPITKTIEDEQITIPDVVVKTLPAVLQPSLATVTPPKPTPNQGEDSVHVSDIGFLLSQAINVIDPGLFQGVNVIDQASWEARNSTFRNDPKSVQGTAFLYPNPTPTPLADLPVKQDEIIAAKNDEAGRIDKYNASTYAQLQRLAADNTIGGKIIDYQSTLPMYERAATINDVANKNSIRRLGIGAYGKPGIDRSDYTADTGLSDKMNSVVYDESAKDYIKLRFKDLRDPTKRRVMFRAFITEFSDNDSVSYEGTSYIGRPDPGRVFTSIERLANIGFTVAAGTRQELRTMYEKLNVLRNMVVPEFKSNVAHMIGGFTSFTLGDYFVDVPCIITNISRDVDPNFPWEINIGPDQLFEAPMMLNVRLSLVILGHATPSTSIKHFDML